MAGSAQHSYVSRFRRKFGVEDELNRYVTALYEMLTAVLGPDKIVLRAGKVNALRMMRSQQFPDRLCALQRLVFENPTLERATTRAQQRKTIAEIEEAMADTIAERHAEDAIERRVNEKMTERHDEYLKDLKLEALRESGGLLETPASQAKLEELEALSQRTLAVFWRCSNCDPNRCAKSLGKKRRSRRCWQKSPHRIRSTSSCTVRLG